MNYIGQDRGMSKPEAASDEIAEQVSECRFSLGVFIDQAMIGEDGPEPWVAHLEAYPSEVLLRVRTNGRTVVLDRLSEDEATCGRWSATKLREIALRHLQMAVLLHSPWGDVPCV
jgi:hypothetical protein